MIVFRTRLKSSSSLIDLTPLVDVVFLMLIFFLVTSDVLPFKSLQIENPTIEKNSSPLTTRFLVVMDAQNVIYVGSKKEIVDLVSLKECLQNEKKKIKRENPSLEPTVVLSVDRRVKYGPFLRLFSICQECIPRIRLVYRSGDQQDADFFEEGEC